MTRLKEMFRVIDTPWYVMAAALTQCLLLRTASDTAFCVVARHALYTGFGRLPPWSDAVGPWNGNRSWESKMYDRQTSILPV
jgi:hypothetical protein